MLFNVSLKKYQIINHLILTIYHDIFIYLFLENNIYRRMEVKELRIRKSFLVSIKATLIIISLFTLMLMSVGATVPPVADAGGPYIGYEGSNIVFDASGSYHPEGDAIFYNWDIDEDGEFEFRDYEDDPTFTFMWDDDYYGDITVSVTDFQYWVNDTTTVTVFNVPPTITSIEGLPIDPIPIDEEIEINSDFTDPGILDNHDAIFNWGDGTISFGTIVESDGSGSASDTHIYSEAGVYTFKLTIVDKDGGEDIEIYQYIVVYDQSDQSSGFITGGGWIDSPEGAYKPDENLTGKANFGFVSKYKKGQSKPSGNTEFQYHMANLNFHSEDYQWLIIAGPKAIFKGNGTINGSGDYGFIIFAIDEELTESTDIDMFRIKIWNKDDNDEIIYDNNVEEEGTELGSGQIVIHKK